MKYSKQGLELTKSFESCRFSSYKDVGGVWTIGYGHTRGVGPDQTCTKEQAEAWLIEDIAQAEQNVNTHVRVTLTQEEFDSLVDFDFNCGSKALNGSTLLKLVNSGDMNHAAREFEKWDHVGGKVVAGLLRRRLAEEKLFKGEN